jgi:hypothetical protein
LVFFCLLCFCTPLLNTLPPYSLLYFPQQPEHKRHLFLPDVEVSFLQLPLQQQPISLGKDTDPSKFSSPSCGCALLVVDSKFWEGLRSSSASGNLPEAGSLNI